MFGPPSRGRIEGSKAFAKDVMERHGLPTAEQARSTTRRRRRRSSTAGGRAVVKADGLAAGKGVTVATDREEAVAAIADCLVAGFGDAGARSWSRSCSKAPRLACSR